MPTMAEWLRIGEAEVSALLKGVAPGDAEGLALAILQARRVFVAGQGRSGWIMRMFALRLMQCGITCHVAGDATTPAIQAGDLLVVGSASGETANPITQATQALAAGADVALVTSQAASTLGRLVGIVVVVPGETTKSTMNGASRMPLASALEQAMLAVLDAIVARIAEQRGEDRAAMMARHANLE